MSETVAELPDVEVVADRPPERVDTPVARLWRRYCTLALVDDEGQELYLSELRITLDVRQFDNQSPNTADVYIYNPAPDTVWKLEREFKRLVIWAGYEDLLGPIFEGTIKQFRYGRLSATDTFLNLRVADGDVAYTQAVINTTLSAGATAEDCVNAILEVLRPFGIQRGTIEGLPPDQSPRAITLSGNVRDVLRDLASSWRTSWSFQLMRLNITPLDWKGINEQDPIVLNAATGLINRPEQTLEGIRVRCLLNPRLTANSTIKLDNASIQRGAYDLSYLGEGQNEQLRNIRITEDGLYRVLSVDHFGDTHGNDWYSDVVCVAVGDPIPIPQAQRGRT